MAKRKFSTVNMKNESGDDLSAICFNTPEAQTLNKELHHAIEKVIDTFNDDNRQIAFLYFFEGMKNREIARIINIPIGTVKSRVHGIRKTLKKELEKYYEN